MDGKNNSNFIYEKLTILILTISGGVIVATIILMIKWFLASLVFPYLGGG